MNTQQPLTSDSFLAFCRRTQFNLWSRKDADYAKGHGTKDVAVFLACETARAILSLTRTIPAEKDYGGQSVFDSGNSGWGKSGLREVDPDQYKPKRWYRRIDNALQLVEINIQCRYRKTQPSPEIIADSMPPIENMRKFRRMGTLLCMRHIVRALDIAASKKRFMHATPG